MLWLEHILDRCCYCWCGFNDDQSYYGDDSDHQCDSKDRKIFKPGTTVIKLSNNNDGGSGVDDVTLSSMERMIKVDFDFDSSSDSVEDDLYYDNYAINKYAQSIEGDDKRVIHSCKMLDLARKHVNTSMNEKKKMDIQDTNVICMCYEQSIGTLANRQQPSLKRKIIKEYEFVKSRVPSNLLKQRQEEIDDLLGNARSMDADIDKRKNSYRNAIKLTVNMEIKKKLKVEYNQFLLLSGSINKYV